VAVVEHMGCYHTGPQQHVWFVEFQLHLQKEIILGQRHNISVTGYVINWTIVGKGNLRARSNIHENVQVMYRGVGACWRPKIDLWMFVDAVQIQVSFTLALHWRLTNDFSNPPSRFRAAQCTKGITIGRVRTVCGHCLHPVGHYCQLLSIGQVILKIGFIFGGVEMRTETLRHISRHFVLAVSRSHLNAETWLRAQSNLCGTCDGRSDAGHNILLNTFAFLAIIVQPKFNIHLQNNETMLC